MSQENVEKTVDSRMATERQVAGIVPARGRSSASVGLAEGLPTCLSAERVSVEGRRSDLTPGSDSRVRPAVVSVERLATAVRLVRRPSVDSKDSGEGAAMDTDGVMVPDSDSGTEAKDTESQPSKKKRERGRPPGPNYKGPSKPFALKKIPRWRTDQSDEEWEYRYGGASGSKGSTKKASKLVPISDAEKGLTTAQTSKYKEAKLVNTKK